MSWWLTNVDRARSEQAALARLLERADWLSELTWRIGDQLELIADVCVRHGAETFNLSMAYPSTFPDTPPMVRPRDGQMLSFHQYGSGGELCLEFRPDNWDASITGAMMVESAHGLLSGERPAESGEGVVRSAHLASLGRDLRGKTRRFVLDPGAAAALASLPLEEIAPLSAWERIDSPTWTAGLTSIGEDGAIWSTTGPTPDRSVAAKGFAFRTDRDIGLGRLEPRLFDERLATDFPEIEAALSGRPYAGFLFVGNEDGWVVYNLHPFQEEQRVYGFAPVDAPNTGSRLPASYVRLSQHTVAIVGCGSVGSKIASTLARSGVRKFILVDDDVFFAGNLVRNDLDAQALGRHKADALAARLKDLAGGVDVSVRRVALGGQESAGSMETVLEDLAKADLLVDATAEPRAFNLIGSVARRNNRPMVWCEVYGGGIGGLVARARPGLDPTPSAARAQIQAWCGAHDAPWAVDAQTDYAVERGQEPPMVADDADVSVIAGHASQFCLDILTRDVSAIPAPAYAIGLRKAWIFEAPFDVWPIELRPQGDWGETPDTGSAEELKALFALLFPKAAE